MTYHNKGPAPWQGLPYLFGIHPVREYMRSLIHALEKGSAQQNALNAYNTPQEIFFMLGPKKKQFSGLTDRMQSPRRNKKIETKIDARLPRLQSLHETFINLKTIAQTKNIDQNLHIEIHYDMGTVVRQHADIHTHQDVMLFTDRPVIRQFNEGSFWEQWDTMKETSPRLLILDGVTDVQNFATIVRSAVALGIDAIIQGADSASKINAASFRLSAGALCWATLVDTANLREFCRQLHNTGIPLIQSVLSEKAENIYHYKNPDIKTKGYALIIGSEQKGIRKGIRQLNDQWVSLPMHGPVQSLNASHAATALIAMLNQMHQQK